MNALRISVCLAMLALAMRPFPADGQTVDRLMLDSVTFDQTDLALALEYLAGKANESGAVRTPVNFVLVDPEGSLAKTAISLKLNRVPWAEALRYTCELGGVSHKWDGTALLVGSKAGVDQMVLQRGKIVAGPGSEQNAARIRAAVIERVSFKEAPLADLAEYLRQIGQTLPGAGGSGARGGPAPGLPFNVMIKENAANPVATRRISLNLHRVSVDELLHFATGLAGCRYRIDARAVVIGEAEDLARPPGGPRSPSGAVFDRLASKTLDAIEIPPGTSTEEFIKVMRELSGVNGIAMTPDAVAASRLSLRQVTALEMLRYFNESSGTAYRLDPTAVVVVNDPAVKVRPMPPALPAPAASGPPGLGFDP